ncbi:cell division control protein 48 homolog C-like [Asparagus officinalis]|nr:cell division control protein 48 homolog C-like [Asparagus officinalis]
MGKRMRRGGRSPASSYSVLNRAAKLDSSFDVAAVVNHLRSRYHDYYRIKVQPFTHRVQKTLDVLHQTQKSSSSHDDDEVNRSTKCRNPNPRRTDESERRLLHAEAEHVRKQKRKIHQADPSDASTAGSTSTYESDDDDAIFEAKVNPEFDLMKSTLRDNYGNKSKPQKEDENLEIEASAGKKRMVIGENLTKVESSMKGGVIRREGTRFEDLGGMRDVLDELQMEVLVPLVHPELLKRLGVRPVAGILLHGPPGCGKTRLAEAIANEAGVPFQKISAPEFISGVSGASEETIRDRFKEAYRTAPSIIFIDEIDAIASKRENLQREMERRIVTQLMTCMDESHHTQSCDDSQTETSEKKPGYVLVIGATNRPDALDQALRRPGRFDREISLGVPDENARLEILSVLTRKCNLEGEFNLMKIARATPGFVGADLNALVNKAGNLAMRRIMEKRKSGFQEGKTDDWLRQPLSPEELASINVTMSDFEEATKMVQPSLRREGFSSIPNTKWEDVGGLNSLRKEFDRHIVQRIKNPEDYEELGLNLEVGFLLHGPPGCGKTLIAKAVANEAGANFIHIKGPELLNKYVGESELAVRTVFSRARTCSPCILFFDEVDALTTMRGKDGNFGDRLLNQLLIELDGADQRKGVYVIGATNRLEVMDPAVLRPGRFGTILYVPLPTIEERGLILKALARKKPVAIDVDLDALGRCEACHNFSGADLSALMNEAAMAALEEKQMTSEDNSSFTRPLVIETSHFEKALVKVGPSVSEKQRIYYEALSRSHRSA